MILQVALILMLSVLITTKVFENNISLKMLSIFIIQLCMVVTLIQEIKNEIYLSRCENG